MMADTYTTFREAAESWLADNRDRIARTTYDRYEDALERDIYPEYGDTPVKEVTEAEMDRFLSMAQELAEKQGRTLKKGSLQVIKAVMSNVIQYANAAENGTKENIAYEFQPYEELTPDEMERICLRAKNNHCPELLSALLALYCGMRTGELCGLSCSDIDLERMEIYIHSTLHRVRNTDKDAAKKTVLIIEEIQRKKQIRRVKIPAVLKKYIEEFLIPGRTLFRSKDDLEPMDPRTLENRLIRVMEAFQLKNINCERLRMTYMNGKADETVLNNIFLGTGQNLSRSGSLNVRWLMDEMARDLAPLRLLLGLSESDMGNMLGVSAERYRSMESGNCNLSWDQYLALLFLFRYNSRTIGVVDYLGLFPQSLKENLKLGG